MADAIKALVVAEHDNAGIRPATLNTVTAATQLGGEVHVLVAGSGAGGAATAAAAASGVTKVLHADGEQFAHGGAESMAAQVLALASGYTHILLWNGTLGDATVESPEELMGLARRYFQPGTIMLGHANHPTVTALFERIQVLLAERDLEPVTLDTMFGSSRAIG